MKGCIDLHSGIMMPRFEVRFGWHVTMLSSSLHAVCSDVSLKRKDLHGRDMLGQMAVSKAGKSMQESEYFNEIESAHPVKLREHLQNKSHEMEHLYNCRII